MLIILIFALPELIFRDFVMKCVLKTVAGVGIDKECN